MNAPAEALVQRWPGDQRAWTFLAPMEGITAPPFRALMSSRGGIGVVCTEFVRVTGARPQPRLFRRQLGRAPRSSLSVQVMGNHIEHLASAAACAVDCGADLIDLNIGCPAPRVVRKGVGSALLKEPELLSRVVEAMRRATPGFLTAKMRAGFDSAGGALGIARRIESAGAQLLTIHPRRRADFYQGVADWRIIRDIARAVSIPVIGNGDVWYATDALRMRAETGCAGVMIGRGALRNPWIFEQIDALLQGREPPHPCGEDVLGHLEALVQLFGAAGDQALGALKQQVRYLGRIVEDRDQLLREALRARSVSELRRVMEARLLRRGPEELDLDARGGRLESSGAAALEEGEGGGSLSCGAVPSRPGAGAQTADLPEGAPAE